MEKVVITGSDQPELLVIFKKEAKIRVNAQKGIVSKKTKDNKIMPLQALFKKKQI